MRDRLPRLLRLLLIAVGLVLIGATALPLVTSNQWWIRIFDFPRAQIAGAILIALALLLWLRPRTRTGLLLAAALVVAFGYQLARILPYTPVYPVDAIQVARCAPGDRLRLLVANVLQDNRDSGALLRLAARVDPDVILLLETDRWWADAVAPLARSHPHRLGEPRPNTYGLLFFSRLPLVDPQLRHLVEDDVPSIRTGLVLPSGARIELFGLHPRPPVPGKDSAQRDAELVLVGREVKRERRPAVVAGDMNDVAWSDTSRLFKQVGGLLDPRIGRGLFPTFPAALPLLRWPLDHVFFNDEIALVDFQRLPDIGSDHLPITAELCHAPAAARLQDEPEQDEGDRRAATEAIREGRQEEREEEREER